MRLTIALMFMLGVSPALAAGETIPTFGLSSGASPNTLCVFDKSASRPCVPMGSLNSTAHTFSPSPLATICNAVTDGGADPTGAVDASAAINTCAAKTANGQAVNIYLPAGTYYLQHQINVPMSCLYGLSRSDTVLKVDSTFDPAATSVILLQGTNSDASGSCVHDLAIKFDQPSDQSTRGNFKTLAQGCTSALGGTGCKYPPAILNFGSSDRERLYNLLIVRAWDGIKLGLGGHLIDHIEESSLDIGLNITQNGATDFGSVAHWEHWSFGINAASNLFTGVYSDANDFAMVLNEMDGSVFTDIRIFRGRLKLDTNWTWGTFDDLQLDGSSMVLSQGAINQLGTRISNGYVDTNSNGLDTNCQINITTSTILNISNFLWFTSPTAEGLCVAGAASKVTVSGAKVQVSNTTAQWANQTAGFLTVTGSTFSANVGAGAWTVPIVGQSAGAINFSSNLFTDTPAGGSVAAVQLTDAVANIVSGNNFNGWGFTQPGRTGTYLTNGTTVYYSAAGVALPTCDTNATGRRLMVSDANGPTFLGNYASGGAVVAPVLCNGTNWVTY